MSEEFQISAYTSRDYKVGYFKRPEFIAHNTDELLKFLNKRNYVSIDENGEETEVELSELDPLKVNLGYIADGQRGMKYVIDKDSEVLDRRDIFQVYNIDTAAFTKGRVRFHDICELEEICHRSASDLVHSGSILTGNSMSLRDVIHGLNQDTRYPRYIYEDCDLIVLENH